MKNFGEILVSIFVGAGMAVIMGVMLLMAVAEPIYTSGV